MARKKLHVMLITLSAKLDDGSRKTINKSEICSCPDRGTAELILYLLRENSYKAICNDKTAKDNESMRFCQLNRECELMVDWYGRWTYEPNTLEEKKCDKDRLADWIISTGYEIKTNIENLCAMIELYFMNECEAYGYDDTVEGCIEYVKDNGISEFDYYC